MKITTARRAYVCHACKGPIAKGAQYAPRQIILGRPDAWEAAPGGGFISHGIRLTVKHCAACAAKGE
jgi:hypothetical protein